jgi:hypothetical protein
MPTGALQASVADSSTLPAKQSLLHRLGVVLGDICRSLVDVRRELVNHCSQLWVRVKLRAAGGGLKNLCMVLYYCEKEKG